MLKFKMTSIIALLVALIPMGLYLYLYPQMPDMVPMHFDIKGNADRFVPKSSSEVPFLAALGLMGFIFFKLIFFFIIRSAARKGEDNARSITKILDITTLCCTVLFAGISVQALFVQAGSFDFSRMDLVRIAAGMLGLIMLLTGNRMPKLRRNSLAGLRTKETMRDEQAWFRAQRFAGKWYVAGGAAMVLGCLLPGWWALYAAIAIFAVVNIVPIVYVKAKLKPE
ncbi:SdpI family protein [Paenibacillus sp. sgz500992]|uniref:SdpI family protein n=1 Tax=Paenibacillus sp. sgz500992 TaxID=3242476 RepID=UPI0036D40718